MTCSAQRRALVAMAVLSGMPATVQTMLIPAFPQLEARLGLDPVDTAWLLTAFLVTASVSAPVLGRLGDLWGRRQLLVGAAVVFAAGGALSWCGVEHFSALLAGRVLQGVAAGSYVLCLATVDERFSARSRASGVGLLAGVVGVGPVIGFVAGGVCAQIGGPSAVFGASAVVGVVAVTLAWWWIPASGGRATGGLDLGGALLLGGVLTAGLALVTLVAVPGVGLVGPVALGAACLLLGILLVCVERRHRNPLLAPDIVLVPAVLRVNAATIASSGAMLGLLVAVPRMVQEPVDGGAGFGLDPVLAAFVLVPGAVAMLAVAPVAVRVGRVIGHAEVVKVAGLVAALGLGLLVIGPGSVGAIVAAAAVVLVGLGLSLGCLPALILGHAPLERAGEAAGTNSLSRGIGSAFGAQATTVVLGAGAFTGDAYRAAFGVGLLCAVATMSLIRGTANGRTQP